MSWGTLRSATGMSPLLGQGRASPPEAIRFLAVAIACLFATSVSADEPARHVGPVTGIVSAGDVIYSCSQAGVLRRDAVAPEHSLVTKPSFRVIGVAGLGDGKLALSGGIPGKSGAVAVVDPSTGETTTAQFAKDVIYAAAVAPSQSFLAAACADGRVLRFSLPLDPSNEPTTIHQHTAVARAVGFSPDGKHVVSGGLDGVVLLTPVDAKGIAAGETRILQDHTAGVECLAFSSDGKHFVSGARDSKVRLHTIEGRLVRTYSGIGMENEPAAERVPARVWAVAWQKDQLVAGTSKGTVYRLSLTDDTWSQLETTTIGSVYALTFDARGTIWIGGDSRLATR